MLHAQLVLFDTDLSVLGSANMDKRSLFLDYELALIMTGAACAPELERWFSALFDACVPLEPPGRVRAIF
jgi:cardiolipin synthase